MNRKNYEVIVKRKSSSESKKKLISFHVYNATSFYLCGLENLRLLPSIYPGWTYRFYVSEEAPQYFVDQFYHSDAEIIIMDSAFEASFRNLCCFLPWDEEDVEVNLVRDVSARVSLREKYAVDEWLESDKFYHIMRDHWSHKFRIIPKLWGSRRGDNVVFDMRSEIEKFIASQDGNSPDLDRIFLSEVLYPVIASRALIHSSTYGFVGENFYPFPNDIDKHRMYLGMSINPEYVDLPPIIDVDLPSITIRQRINSIKPILIKLLKRFKYL